jgi:hypothetical protein
VAQAEFLLCNCGALSSNPSPTKKMGHLPRARHWTTTCGENPLSPFLGGASGGTCGSQDDLPQMLPSSVSPCLWGVALLVLDYNKIHQTVYHFAR